MERESHGGTGQQLRPVLASAADIIPQTVGRGHGSGAGSQVHVFILSSKNICLHLVHIKTRNPIKIGETDIYACVPGRILYYSFLNCNSEKMNKISLH